MRSAVLGLGSLRGPWRVAVAEESMSPALRPGDWLLLDPIVRRWPRRGSAVVVREPGTGLLVVKRVAAGPGDTVFARGERVRLVNEAWLLGDEETSSIDSRQYGPVPREALVARVWLRYWPPHRIGLIRRPRVQRPDPPHAAAT
jgi:signal peptidase I